jgi:hypothetical protein
MKRKADTKVPEVKIIEKRFADIPAGAKMLVSSPSEIREYLQQIKPGERRTLIQMREDLAVIHEADKTCPVSTSIYLRIVSSEAVEAVRNMADIASVAPFWRVIDLQSPVWKKLELSEQESAYFSSLP